MKHISFCSFLSLSLQRRANTMWMSQPLCRYRKTKMHYSRTICWLSTRSNTDHVSAQTSPTEGRPRVLQGQAMRGDRALTYAWVEKTTDTSLPLSTFETIPRWQWPNPAIPNCKDNIFCNGFHCLTLKNQL